MNVEDAFDRYEAIRQRLPQAVFVNEPKHASDLGALADEADTFVFDAFGVLNVGERPIAGARARIDRLREAGKSVYVLTNAASFTAAKTREKFRRLGFDFADEEIVSSRDICERAMRTRPATTWGVAAHDTFRPEELAINSVALGDEQSLYDSVDGFLLLSSSQWNAARQGMLKESLKRRPRPVVVANPDLVAPREDGLSLEPGYYAHELEDTVSLEVSYFGKPYPPVFEHIETLIGPNCVRRRIAMVGDTLHTDIIGAAARGWTSVLVTNHGLLAGREFGDYIVRSGIRPDWIVPSI